MSQPRECPRFERCSASVCPLDEKWRERSHLRDDRVCKFLTEAIKKPFTSDAEDASKTHFKVVIDEGIRVRVYDTLAEILTPPLSLSKNKGNKHGILKRQLERSAKLAQEKAKRETALNNQQIGENHNVSKQSPLKVPSLPITFTSFLAKT